MKNTMPLRQESGVALVTTVIVVAVLAIVAVAFMQSTSMDRLSSRTVTNYYRAQLAADAGIAAASVALARGTGNDTFLVVENSQNRQLYVGTGIAGSTEFSYLPLFSTTPNLTNVVRPVVTGGVPTTNVMDPVTFAFDLPGGVAVQSPGVTWTYLTNTDGTTNARFAYWVEDLGGRLDLSVVGTNAASPVARRPTGTDPAEIALWSLFRSNALSAQQAGDVVGPLMQARSFVATPATALLASQDLREQPALLTNLATGLVHAPDPEMVPFGFAYANEGQPKRNLNGADFSSVRTWLSSNLPNFGQRGGGVQSSNYYDNIAANIVDFIDADNAPTAGDGYRGVEVLPFLNERATRYTIQGPPINEGGGGSGSGGEGGRWVIRIVTTEFLEFWNLHSVATDPASLTIAMTNNQQLFYFSQTNFNINTNFVVQVPSMPPGSFFVTNTPEITNEFSVASALGNPWPGGSAPICTLLGGNTTVTYSIASDGAVFDHGKGSHYSSTFLRNTPLSRRTYFSPGYPGLGSKSPIAGIADSSFFNSVGDPRATFYMAAGGVPFNQIQPSYADGNTSFGGRNVQSGMDTARLSKEVRMENWGDKGHNGTTGTAGSAANNPPPLGAFHTGEADYAPARANTNTAGSLDRITDLSAVFDPLAWSQSGTTFAGRPEPGAWTNLTANASPNRRYVGGNTLRIGRPEFTRFTNDGLRAAQLLDIFAVGGSFLTYTNNQGSMQTNTNVLVNIVPGRINLNTATPETLRAWGAGVFHDRDPLLQGGASGDGTNFVVPVAAVDSLVDAIVTRRTQKPFYSAAEAAMASTAAAWPDSAVFGNPLLMGITAANDAAAELWFSRVYPLASVRSRNFAVYVIGQALAPSASGPVPVSTFRAVYQVHSEALRDPADGRATNAIVRTVRSASL